MNGSFSDDRLPPCSCRHAVPQAEGLWFCAHPRVHVVRNLVSSEICRMCTWATTEPPADARTFHPGRVTQPGVPCYHLGPQTGQRQCQDCRGNVQLKLFACQHPLHVETTLPECERCLDFSPRLQQGTVRTWAVGVTTAPRTPSYLGDTLQSLARAGWDQVRVFAEAGSRLPDGLPADQITHRQPAVGAVGNWLLSLAELIQRQPEADAYLLCQDDLALCHNLRAYLERSLWPAAESGCVSLYAAGACGPATERWQPLTERDPLLGALALVCARPAAERMLAAAWPMQARWAHEHRAGRRLDDLLRRCCAASELPIHVHRPSLVQHLGEVSTLWASSNREPLRSAGDFPGEEFDALSLLAQTPTAAVVIT